MQYINTKISEEQEMELKRQNKNAIKAGCLMRIRQLKAKNVFQKYLFDKIYQFGFTPIDVTDFFRELCVEYSIEYINGKALMMISRPGVEKVAVIRILIDEVFVIEFSYRSINPEEITESDVFQILNVIKSVAEKLWEDESCPDLLNEDISWPDDMDVPV